MPNKTKKKNATKIVVISIIGLATLLILIFVISYTGILQTANLTLNSSSIKNEIEQVRKVAEPNFDSQQSNLISALYATGVITNSAPTYSAKVDYCYFTSDKKDKFNTVNWNQNCTLRYIDILETTLTRDEILQKLASNSDVPNLFGEPYLYDLGKNGKCDPIYRSSDNRSTTLSLLDWSRENNTSCQIYDPSKNNTVNFGPNSFKVIRGYDVKNVDKSKSYLYISRDNTYFTKSLGCGSKDLFGCREPISEPITVF